MSVWTLAPDWQGTDEPEFNTIISTFESGVEQRRARRTDSRRSWRLSFSNRSRTDMETGRDFFLAVKGSFTSFTWTNPLDSAVYTVRFADDGFRITHEFYEVFSFECTFVEVI